MGKCWKEVNTDDRHFVEHVPLCDTDSKSPSTESHRTRSLVNMVSKSAVSLHVC